MPGFSNSERLKMNAVTEVEPTVSEELSEFWRKQGNKNPSGRGVMPNAIFNTMFLGARSIRFATGIIATTNGN